MNRVEGINNFPGNGEQGEVTPNRAARRQRLRGADPIQKETIRASEKLRGLDHEIHQLLALRNRAAAAVDHDLWRVIFEAKPFAQRYLAATRLIPSYLTAVYRTSASNPSLDWHGLDKIELHDLFHRKVGSNILMDGTSLADIEQMPLGPNGLLPEDIGRFNRMFYTGFIFYRMNPAHREVNEMMLYQATQKFARPEDNIVTPKELQPLDDRLTAFFDYHTGLMTNFSLPEEQELIFYQMMALGRPWFIQSLGCYLPARLGITPSSALKLYRQRGMAFSSWMMRQTWGEVLCFLDIASKNAIKPGRLPQDLDKFQRFDPEVDQQAAASLGNYYRSELSTASSEGVKPAEQLEQLLDKVKLYKLPLYKTVMRSTDRHVASSNRLDIQLPEGFPAHHLLITAQYPQTMMLILPFGEGRAHLTLEISRDNNLYGLPPKLAYDNPHLSDALLSDLLPPLIGGLRSAYPSVEKEARQAESVVVRVEPKPRPTVEKSVAETMPVYTPQVRERVQRLPKRLLTPLSEYLAGPKPISSPEIVRRQNFVRYSRSEVVSNIGRNIPDRVIDQIMRDIKEFEYGRGDFKKMTDIELWEIRSGKYRVVLSPGNGNTFYVEGVVARKDLGKLLSKF